MKIANLEAAVADKQVRLSSGEMEVNGGVCLVALLPLVDPKLCDPFPFYLAARGVPRAVHLLCAFLVSFAVLFAV